MPARIFYFEDVYVTREDVKKHLEDEGFIVDDFATFTKAMKRVNADDFNYDYVLLDFLQEETATENRNPDAGLQLAEAIREKGLKCPFVFHTAQDKYQLPIEKLGTLNPFSIFIKADTDIKDELVRSIKEAIAKSEEMAGGEQTLDELEKSFVAAMPGKICVKPFSEQRGEDKRKQIIEVSKILGGHQDKRTIYKRIEEEHSYYQLVIDQGTDFIKKLVEGEKIIIEIKAIREKEEVDEEITIKIQVTLEKDGPVFHHVIQGKFLVLSLEGQEELLIYNFSTDRFLKLLRTHLKVHKIRDTFININKGIFVNNEAVLAFKDNWVRLSNGKRLFYSLAYESKLNKLFPAFK